MGPFAGEFLRAADIDQAGLPVELLEATNLVGPESYVKERIEAYRESGVTMLNVAPIDADQPALIEKVKGWLS